MSDIFEAERATPMIFAAPRCRKSGMATRAEKDVPPRIRTVNSCGKGRRTRQRMAIQEDRAGFMTPATSVAFASRDAGSMNTSCSGTFKIS